MRESVTPAAWASAAFVCESSAATWGGKAMEMFLIMVLGVYPKNLFVSSADNTGRCPSSLRMQLLILCLYRVEVSYELGHVRICAITAIFKSGAIFINEEIKRLGVGI